MTSPTFYHPRPERWPRFTLKGMFIATTLVAILLPWVVAEYRAWDQRRDYEWIPMGPMRGQKHHDTLLPSPPARPATQL